MLFLAVFKFAYSRMQFPNLLDFYENIFLIYFEFLIFTYNNFEYFKILRHFGNKTLKNANDKLSKKGISAKTLLKEGNVVNEIDKTVKKEKCTLLVVGSKGLGAVTRFLLGSVSNKLAQISSCSLMIVK